MRRILGDRLSGIPAAALIAYAVLFQGLVGAYAQGALAAQQGSAFVICSPAGTAFGEAGETPLERTAHDCCAVLCQAGAFHGVVAPAAAADPAFVSKAGSRLRFQAKHTPPRPSASGLLPQPRAPPLVSA